MFLSMLVFVLFIFLEKGVREDIGKIKILNVTGYWKNVIKTTSMNIFYNLHILLMLIFIEKYVHEK